MMIRRRKLFMDTIVDIQVVTGLGTVAENTDEKGNRLASEQDMQNQINRAFHAFRQVEQACSRFSLDSELMRATRQIGEPVQVSSSLFEPLKLALHMAELTSGIFDPTVGKRLEQHGFNQHYLTHQYINSPAVESATYRDIELDEVHQTMTLLKPLVIDLGAVAKGFAIDLAAHELQSFAGFMVNAGEIYMPEAGMNKTSHGRSVYSIPHMQMRLYVRWSYLMQRSAPRVVMSGRA